jgi:hypothetical protein
MTPTLGQLVSAPAMFPFVKLSPPMGVECPSRYVQISLDVFQLE